MGTDTGHERLGRNSQKRERSRFRTKFETLENRELLAALVWASGPSLPQARTDAVAVVAPNDAVYLLGGDAAAPMETPRLNPGATNWGTGYNTDTSRVDLGAVRVGNDIILFGGGQNGEGTEETLAYDYSQGDSQDLEKMNQVRFDLGFASDANGRAYAIGGIGIQEDGDLWSEVERYDPATDVWSQIAPLPQALHGLSAIGDGNGSIFVFGGSSSINGSAIQNSSYRYDIVTDTWHTIAPMPIGTQDSAVVADDSGAIYVLGGFTSSGATDAVQVYDPTINAWSSETSLPEPIYAHAAAYDSLGQIIVAGGFDANSNPTTAVYLTQRLNIAETAPVFTTSGITAGSLDTFYSYAANATGNPTPSYSLIDPPAGMTIDSASGLVTWQPVAGQVGVHPVTVRASNTVGDADQSFDVNVVADTIAPTAPSNVTVDSVTETSVTISWDASTDAIGVERYEVSTAIYTGPRFAKRWVYTLVDTVTTPTSTITGLTPFTTTTLSIQAFDAAGNASLRSARTPATTESVPTLAFSVGTQTTGTVTSPALHPLEIQLSSRANPTAEFSIVTGPTSMTVNPTSGLVQWTPTVAELGTQTLTFRAENSVGFTDLDVVIDIIADVPQLSVSFNPTTGGDGFALAGTLFNAQINDASQSASTYQLITWPTGMTIDGTTGLISWTPVGNQGGTHPVTVLATNAGGTADLSFAVLTHFTGPVSGVTVTGQTLLTPTVTWTAPTGEGAELVDSYNVNAYVRYRYGSHTWRTHSVDYTTSVGSESVELTGLLTGKNYTLTITPIDAAGNTGLANRDATTVSAPALPQISWSVNGFTGGSSVPGPVIADQPATIVLTDGRADPSFLTLVHGPAGLTFDETTNTATWTPGASDVTTGYTTTDVTFEATNSIGSVNVVVPIRVFFSGTVHNASATKNGTAVTVQWDPPTDNAKPIAGYQITAHWTWSGRPRSSTRTVGNVTSASYAQYPTGAVSHKGVRITPIDADGNLGVESELIVYGAPPNGSAPVAADDVYDATEDTPLSIDYATGVLANDTDIDGNTLTAQISTQPSGGTVTLATNGSFTYTPNPNFNGPDSFTYFVRDGAYNSNIATVTINVAAVNDTPAALYDYYTTDSGVSINIDAIHGVLANDNDIDNDPLNANNVDGPANGTVVLNLDGSFDYMPNAGFVGTDSFSYVANDGTVDSNLAQVSVVVQNTNVAPTASLAGPASGVPFQPFTLTLTAADSSPADQAAGFTFDIDWDGDDVVDQTIVGPSGTQVTHAYESVDANLIKVTASDQNAAASGVVTHAINIVRVEMQGADLVWGGTTGEDAVEFEETASQTIKVRATLLDGVAVSDTQTFGGVTGQVIAFGGDSDDTIDAGGVDGLTNIGATLIGGRGHDTIDGGDAADTIRGDAQGDGSEGRDVIDGGGGDDLIYGDGMEGAADTIMGGDGNDTIYGDNGDVGADGAEGNDVIYGNDGDDTLFGGKGKDSIFGGNGNDIIDGQNGHDILSGGTGNDSLTGGTGNDLLFAGAGADTLHGNGGDDLLVAGSTSFDFIEADLKKIGNEWWSSGNYATRVANIGGASGGANDPVFLQPGVTVFDDGEVDTLFGEGETDWFLDNQSGLNPDILWDLDVGEVETDIAP